MSASEISSSARTRAHKPSSPFSFQCHLDSVSTWGDTGSFLTKEGCSKQGGLPRKIPKAPPTHPIPPIETPAHITSCCGPLLLETAITLHQRKGVRGPCSVQMTDDSEVKQRVSRAPCMLAWSCLTLICFLPLILIQFSSCISPGPQRS